MNPLEQLREIHLAEDVGIWPLAYGWWLLAALCVASLIVTLRYVIRRRRSLLAKRQAIAALKQIDGSSDNWPYQLNGLLKRLALTYYPSVGVASLHLQSWSAFLAHQMPPKLRDSFMVEMQKIQDTLYQSGTTEVVYDDAAKQVTSWIQHAVPPTRKRLAEWEANHV